jgi:hypothetical protein
MPYSSSDYDSAVSAFNVLPESMAVENLIRLRQGNEAGAMSNRKMARDETYDLSEDVMAKSFGKHLSETSHLSQEERQASTQQWMDNNEGSYASKAVLAASAQNELLRGASARATHRDSDQSKNKLEMAKAKDSLENLDEDQQVERDTRMAQRDGAMANAGMALNRSNTDLDMENQQVVDSFAGSIQSVPLETQQKINEYLYSIRTDPEKKEVGRYVGRLANILEGASQMKTAESYMLDEHKAIMLDVSKWRGGRNALPPQNDAEWKDFESKHAGKTAAVLEYKEDVERYESADKSMKAFNRKLAGGAEETLPDNTVVPAVKGLVDRLNEAHQDRTPAGRQAEAKIMGEMMSMAQPASAFVRERIKLHDDTIKSRGTALKVRKTEEEIKKLEAQIGSTKSGKTLIDARVKTEEGKGSRADKLAYLRWLSAPGQQERLNDADEKELRELDIQLAKEWGFMKKQLDSMGISGGDVESDDSSEKDPID